VDINGSYLLEIRPDMTQKCCAVKLGNMFSNVYVDGQACAWSGQEVSSWVVSRSAMLSSGTRPTSKTMSCDVFQLKNIML
jgi:hypothetical protein